MRRILFSKLARIVGLTLVLVWQATAQPSAREAVLTAMRDRPNDPWPRGRGHVVLALPGSREEDKAYYEPGGGFSPAFATFGVSLWITDAQGNIQATSDSIPLDEVRQTLVWTDPKTIPGIQTETPLYRLLWSSAGAGRWRLQLQSRTRDHVALVVRSVGPAGGALESLAWDGQRLLIDQRWTLTPSPRVSQVQLGPERVWRPPQGQNSGQGWSSDNGWGFARFALPGTGQWEFLLQDTRSPSVPALAYGRVRSGVELQVPDPAFAPCLDAQVAHLMMGLVGKETRPGEPNNYPLNWLRDDSYVLVALARAGQLALARQLCVPFAEHDFFGGFGAEADAPGLALWALGELAAPHRDAQFDRWLWPHVQRKAQLLEAMLATPRPLREPFAGPVVPAYRSRPDLDLVCEAATNGLIQGRMDWQRPVLFVNAVGYRGLLEAAAVADRLHQTTAASRWRARAASLRTAWNRALPAPRQENERTYIAGLYPTWVVSDPAAYGWKLQGFWDDTHDQFDQPKTPPLWPYFTLAEAHQWLGLRQPERAWGTLRWFWEHQASPGLYTWGEGQGEENSFGRWERLARGWVKPPNVTPHYWAAAEMILLQLDMLAYVDESNLEPVLVIGAGVPRAWLDHPLTVAGVGTRLGVVDWRWQDGHLGVTVHGHSCPVRLGSGFAPGTPMAIRFEPHAL